MKRKEKKIRLCRSRQSRSHLLQDVGLLMGGETADKTLSRF